MDAEIVKKIEESGFKKKYIAKKIDITPAYLRLCMIGERNLSGRKEQKLIELLSFSLAGNEN